MTVPLGVLHSELSDHCHLHLRGCLCRRRCGYASVMIVSVCGRGATCEIIAASEETTFNQQHLAHRAPFPARLVILRSAFLVQDGAGLGCGCNQGASDYFGGPVWPLYSGFYGPVASRVTPRPQGVVARVAGRIFPVTEMGVGSFWSASMVWGRPR